jgi:uracil-DNA glycosylase family 4
MNDLPGWIEHLKWELESSGDPLLHPVPASQGTVAGVEVAKSGTGVPSAEIGTGGASLKDRLRMCGSLEALEALCAGSAELRTDLDGTRLVFGVGHPQADLMLIGEAPGEQEDLQGEPFVGRAGMLLNDILKAIQLDRSKIYIANILKHRPPGNRNPTEEERARSLPYLIRQIELVRPKLILALGRISAGTLLGSDAPLADMRGTFHPFMGTELLVTYHPAALLRNPSWKRPTWEDVQRLRDRYIELGCEPTLSEG